MILYSAVTDTGLIRPNNEDSVDVFRVFDAEEENLFVVADGMGGHKGGEVASRFVVENIPRVLEKMKDPGEPAHFLHKAVREVNSGLYAEAQNSEDLYGMGSTLVMAYFENGFWHIVNVGDSRAYYYEKGALVQITRDHSLVEELVEKGQLTRDDPLYEARKNVITRAMGVAEFVEEDYFTFEAVPGSRLLLCTDGVHGMLPDGEILRALEDFEDADSAAVELVKRALAAGGKDNITAIVADYDL